MMDIKVRAMTFSEYEKYQDFVDDLTEKDVKQNKISRESAKFIMKEIYNVDVAETNLNPGKIMSIVTKTVELTFAVEEEETKN